MLGGPRLHFHQPEVPISANSSPLSWLFTLKHGKTFYRPSKRTIDLFLALVILLFSAPISLIVALGVGFSSRGGILYRSERVGKNGRLFTMLKFRSMYEGSDTDYLLLRDMNIEHRNGPFFKDPYDPRVTPFGRIIRRLSLDEIPQLWNVLRGEMSLVGPRPAFEVEIKEMGAHGQRRLAVLPGVTGLCQISGRSNLPYERCARLEEIYIEHASVLLDLWVIGKTAVVALRKIGAH